tara:strand:- start:585 stop:1190 length:606 start_codon:yes stop_codon:yes gene_type:complete
MAVVCKKTDFVFKAQNIPRFLGCGPRNRTKDENIQHAIDNYIIPDGRLNQKYYDSLDVETSEKGHNKVFQDYLDKQIFTEQNKHDGISEIVGEMTYTPREQPTGIAKIEVNEKIGLLSELHGITRDGETVIIWDEYWNRPKLPYGVEDEIKIKMLGTMAVWKAKKCIYILSEMNNQTITLDFDSEKWQDILTKLQEIDYGI